MSEDTRYEIMRRIDSVNKMSDLEDIWDACSDRMGDLKKAKTRKLKRILNVGDVVRLSTRMKPRYLCEVEGPILEFSKNRALIQLPEDSALRRMSGLTCFVPLSAITTRVKKAGE